MIETAVEAANDKGKAGDLRVAAHDHIPCLQEV